MAGLAGTWHKPSAKALAHAEKVKEDAESEKKKAEKIQSEVKNWADKRVAEVANQLTNEKTKTKNLTAELDRAEKTISELSKGLEIYHDHNNNKKNFKKV